MIANDRIAPVNRCSHAMRARRTAMSATGEGTAGSGVEPNSPFGEFNAEHASRSPRTVDLEIPDLLPVRWAAIRPDRER